MLCQQGFCNFRAEVAQIYAQRVAACLLDILQSLYHMDLALYNTDRTFINIRNVIICLVSLYQSLSSVDRQRFRDTVPADCYNTDFHFR